MWKPPTPKPFNVEPLPEEPWRHPAKPTQQQMVEAFEHAVREQEADRDCDIDDGTGFERYMLQRQHQDIVTVQDAQFRDSARRRQEALKLSEDEQIKLYFSRMDPETFQAAWAKLTDDLKSLFDSIVDQFAPLCDAISEAIQPLRDQLEDQPPQALCPSHRKPLKGGSCPICQRQRRRK